MNNFVDIIDFQTVSSNMDKEVEITKEEWMENLQMLRVTRTDMNRLIMNYLVSRSAYNFIFHSLNIKYDIFFIRAAVV